MRERLVFDFLPDQGRKPGPQGQHAPEQNNKTPPDRSFEPTRDGWRAYQAWCKQVRESWEGDE
jgi:hypothetical protein